MRPLSAPHGAPWRTAFSACVLSLVLGACAARRPAPLFIHPDGPPANPFSPAVRVGPLVFVSGTLGQRPDGTMVPGGIRAETQQVMVNIQRTLQAAGLDVDRLVQCTVYMPDLSEWPAMNEVYRTWFKNGKYPARAAVQATLLFGARVELACTAAAR